MLKAHENTLEGSAMMPWPALPSRSSSTPGVQVQGTAPHPLSQQQTMPQPVVPASSNAGNPVDPPLPMPSTRRRYTRILAIVVTLALAVTIYFIWHSPTVPTSAPSISQQNFGSTSSNSTSDSTGSSTSDSGDIK